MIDIIIKINLKKNKNVKIINSNKLKILKPVEGIKKNHIFNNFYNFSKIYSQDDSFQILFKYYYNLNKDNSFLYFFYNFKLYLLTHKNGFIINFYNNIKTTTTATKINISIYQVNGINIIDLLNNNKFYKIDDFNKITNKIISNQDELIKIMENIKIIKTHLFVIIKNLNKNYIFVLLHSQTKSINHLITCIKSINLKKKYIPFNNCDFTRILHKLNFTKIKTNFFINIYTNIIHYLNFANNLQNPTKITNNKNADILINNNKANNENNLYLQLVVFYKHLYIETIKINCLIEEKKEISDLNQELIIKLLNLKNYIDNIFNIL